MSIESSIFEKFIVDKKSLIKYGFKLSGQDYIYEVQFMDGDFSARIVINRNGEVSGTVFDTENDEEYLPLRIDEQQGAFVGKVRDEYSKILTDIREKCFSQKYFISPQANRLAELIKKKYGDEPEFLWEKFPNLGVFRNQQSEKWYAIVMDVELNKLGEDSDKKVDVVNLKIDKDKIPELVKQNGIYPAWHMNKKYWITVCLNNTVDDDEIMQYVAESYSYTIKKSSKRKA